MTVDFSQKQEALEKLFQTLQEEPIPCAEPWMGADVVVTDSQPPKWKSEFYPEPRYVVTPHARQLSWLMIQLRDIFSDLYDSASKIEFFGRLANAAIRYQKICNDKEEQYALLAAVLKEAKNILQEMQNGTFEHFLVAPGNMIVDDLIDLMSDISREAKSRGLTPEILNSLLKE